MGNEEAHNSKDLHSMIVQGCQQHTLSKAFNDLVQLIRLAGAASGRLFTDDDVCVDVGMYEVPICCPSDCAFDAHQTMLLPKRQMSDFHGVLRDMEDKVE